MNMLETILGAQDGAAVRQIGSQLGLPEDRTTAALSALVPAIAAGLQRNATNAGGLESLLGALSSGKHALYLESLATLSQPDAIADGNGILGHVFGSKEVSREIASRAAAQTGIGVDVLKRMLPMVAALTMGTLARQSAASTAAPTSGLAGTAGNSLLGLLAGTIDQNRTGSMLDDVMGVVGGFLRK